MEEKKLTGVESLELISSMIEQTKRRMEAGSGNNFLVYGYTAAGLSAVIYVLVRFTGNPEWNAAWFLMFLPAIVALFNRKRRAPEVVTYIDRVVSQLWGIVGSLFGLTVVVMAVMSGILGAADFSLMLPLSLLYAGIGTSVTGIAVREPWLVYMPLAGFVFAIYMLMSYSPGSGTQPIWNLYFGLSFLLMMVVPGHVLNRKSKSLCCRN